MGRWYERREETKKRIEVGVERNGKKDGRNGRKRGEKRRKTDKTRR